MASTRSGDSEGEITWEDLLLAYAVDLHGKSWDAVAKEVQSRIPAAAAHLLTPQRCLNRYRDLHRRFAVDSEDNGGDEVPWLEELRKFRVAELRRDVERSDVSINSLQLEVRRLEERERSLEGGGKDSDLKGEGQDAGSPGSSPEDCAGDRISGGDSGRSCKESNSTDPDPDPDPKPEDGKLDKASVPAGGKLDPAAATDEKAAGEGSYNGSSDTIAKGHAAAEAEAARVRVGESGESVAESKEGEKESSDVQSSASLSKRRRRGRRRKAVSGSSGGEGREGGEVSKGKGSESEPLEAIMEIVRSKDYGTVFERRLESQKSPGYRTVIRRHVDLEMVRTKMDRGAYGTREFFRDLLLLCTNAIVFFPRGSPESIAAVQLRDLVFKEMHRNIQKPPPPIKEPTPPPPPPPVKEPTPPPPPTAPKPKLEFDIKIPIPMIACKKRSSISTKPATPVTKEERDEKKDDDRILAQKKIGTRGLRTNKSRGRGQVIAPAPAPAPAPASAPVINPVPAETLPVPAKMQKKTGRAVADPGVSTKKRGAATFLNRINGKSPTSSTKGTLLETLKSSSSKGSEQKKVVEKGDGRKDQVSRPRPKAAAEQAAPVKRSVGRPPKRAAPPPTPPPVKRAREEVEAGPSKATPPAPAKKKGRKW